MAITPLLEPLQAIAGFDGNASAAAVASASGVANPLPFAMQPQAQTKWCWAATAASMSAYYKDTPAIGQCEVATQCLGIPCCIIPLPPPTCAWEGNQMYTLQVALQVVVHSAHGPEDPLDFASLVAELRAGHPVGCQIQWDGGGAAGGAFQCSRGIWDGSRGRDSQGSTFRLRREHAFLCGVPGGLSWRILDPGVPNQIAPPFYGSELGDRTGFGSPCTA